jgi:hypothetical protein
VRTKLVSSRSGTGAIGHPGGSVSPQGA